MKSEALARSYTSLTRAILAFPKAPWLDAMSHGQMQSKAWAIDELLKSKRHLGLVYIVNGSLGLFGPLLFADPKLRVSGVRSFDIDSTCQPVADRINIEHVITAWRYKAITKDLFDIDYEDHRYEIVLPGGYFDKDEKFLDHKPAQMHENPDTIINTSCDLVTDFRKWWQMIPKGKLVLLQNNNFSGGQVRLNMVNTLDEMSVQAPMSRIIYSGEREYMKYTSFMLIGLR